MQLRELRLHLQPVQHLVPTSTACCLFSPWPELSFTIRTSDGTSQASAGWASLIEWLTDWLFVSALPSCLTSRPAQARQVVGKIFLLSAAAGWHCFSEFQWSSSFTTRR